MKLGFVTCVELGLSCMEAIYEIGGRLSLAITLPDDKSINKSGRVFIDEFCYAHKIPLIKSSHVNDQVIINKIKFEKIDWLFIIGWSQIANASILSAPILGVLGAHPTLLPQGRGRAAIPWAILKGLRKTGVSLLKLDEGVDTGPLLAQNTILINENETATTLYHKVNLAHVELIRQIIPQLINRTFSLRHQDQNQVSEWPARRPQEGEIDLDSSVWDAERLIRAVTRPYPGAFYYNNEGRKVIVWGARATSIRPTNENYIKFYDGYLILEEIS